MQILQSSSSKNIWTDITTENIPTLDSIIQHLKNIRDRMSRDKNTGVRRNVQFDEYEKIKSDINIVKQQKGENVFDVVNDIPFCVANEAEDEEEGFVRIRDEAINLYTESSGRHRKRLCSNNENYNERIFNNKTPINNNNFLSTNNDVNYRTSNKKKIEINQINKQMQIIRSEDDKDKINALLNMKINSQNVKNNGKALMAINKMGKPNEIRQQTSVCTFVQSNEIKNNYPQSFINFIDKHTAKTIRDLIEYTYLYKKSEKKRINQSFYTCKKRGINSYKNFKPNKNHLKLISIKLTLKNNSSNNKVNKGQFKKSSITDLIKEKNCQNEIKIDKQKNSDSKCVQSLDEICQLNNIVKLNLKKNVKGVNFDKKN
ncbi:hypothetical protein COBT_001271 [Conglomerata obtusa]